MRRIAAFFGALCLALVNVSCGGGGGDDGGLSGLSFSPSTLTANFRTGTSATLTVRATALNPSVYSGGVYVLIVDAAQVLTGTVNLSRVDSATFAATVYTMASLAPGRYQGSFAVHVCRDPGCSSEYPGSPASLPYDFTVTNLPLTAVAARSTALTGYVGGSATQSVAVNVTGTGAWTVASSAAWLKAPAGGTGNGSASLVVDPTGLAAGQYAADATVRGNDGQQVVVPFSLTMLPNQFTLTSGVPSFSFVNGTTVPAQNLGFMLGNGTAAAWSALTTAPWLIASPQSGSTPASVSLRADPSQGPLASGAYAADLVLSSAGLPDKRVSTQLSLIKPALTASVQSVTLGGANGRDMAAAQAVQLSLNTGSTRWPWQLSGVPAWLTATPGAATVGQDGVSLGLVPNPAAVTAGSVSATLTATAVVNGDTVSVPITVNLNADQHRVLPSEWAVAFSQTPTGTRLTRTLTLRDNFGVGLPWTAVSDSPWLTVTPSGTTGGAASLVLTADPAALADGSLSLAKVTIASPQAGVEPQVVRVGLWKSASGLAAMKKLTGTFRGLVADPLRPYVYTHQGGTAIDVFHAYTAQKLTTINGVGSALSALAVSPDGSRLYALDSASRTMAVVDLDAQGLVETWPMAQAVQAAPLIAVKPNGVEVVFIGNRTAYSAGRSLGTTPIGAGSMAAPADGRRVYLQDSGSSPSGWSAFDVDYTSIGGGTLAAVYAGSGTRPDIASNGQDIAVSRDGSSVFTATGAPYKCARFNASDLSFVGPLPGGNAYPTAVEVTVDGRILCGASTSSSEDFWVHTPAGALIRGYDLGSGGSLGVGGLAATSDGMVVVAISQDAATLSFVPIGAP